LSLITTLNTALSLITMPLIATWVVSSFTLTGKVVVLPPGKVIEVIALVIIGAISQVYKDMARVITLLGPIVSAFNVLNLCIGYGISRAAGMEKPASTAVGFSMGVRNGTLALLIAFGVFRDLEMALPIAIYSALIYITAALFGFILTRRPLKAKR
jgi:bile acid:Na+ symporter, BASS family